VRRLALGLTQEAPGKLVGVSQDTVSKWELGRKEASKPYLRRVGSLRK
jgi:DNA-binding transcriptional regulator YiaG